MRFYGVLMPAEEGGYLAQCVEVPGAISEGPTPDATLENVRDAIRLVLAVRLREAEEAIGQADPSLGIKMVEVLVTERDDADPP